MKVLVSGASGLIGDELCRRLLEDGHQVDRLVRRAPRDRNEHNWAPSAHILDAALLVGVDAVVNLSGASLGRLPWTARYRRELRSSRLDTTRTITDAMAMVDAPPGVLINASAVGYYGDRPGHRLTEEAGRGDGFLADLSADWEAAASLAPERTRVVMLRTGLVVARHGALRPFAAMTRLGLGGPIGTGGQHWPWISLYDEVAAIRHLLVSEVSGPVNLVGPVPCTADGMLRALAAETHRPYALRVSERIVRLGLSDAGRELLLSSQKAIPQKLCESGFRFRHDTAADAIAATFSGGRSGHPSGAR